MLLEDVGSKLQEVPEFERVFVLEEFEGPLFSELRRGEDGVYLEKWCARHSLTNRTLVVASNRRVITEFLNCRISMYEALTVPSANIGFLLDYRGGEVIEGRLVEVSALPSRYLPPPDALHDASLRPSWERASQDFLFESWSVDTFHDLLWKYRQVFAFEYAARHAPKAFRSAGVLGLDLNAGWNYQSVVKALEKHIPERDRVESVGVQANSPGVFSMRAPADIAKHVARALERARGRTAKQAYRRLHRWSRLATEHHANVPDSALADLHQLCKALGVPKNLFDPAIEHASEVKLPAHPTGNSRQLALLQAGKVAAAYYVRLQKILKLKEAEFLIDKSFLEHEDDNTKSNAEDL